MTLYFDTTSTTFYPFTGDTDSTHTEPQYVGAVVEWPVISEDVSPTPYQRPPRHISTPRLPVRQQTVRMRARSRP